MTEDTKPEQSTSDFSPEELALHEQLLAKYGEVFHASFLDRGGAKVRVYYRAPDRVESKFFKDAARDKSTKKQEAGVENLARQVVVHPSREAFDALCLRRPLIADKIAADALAIASGEESELGKPV